MIQKYGSELNGVDYGYGSNQFSRRTDQTKRSAHTPNSMRLGAIGGLPRAKAIKAFQVSHPKLLYTTGQGSK